MSYITCTKKQPLGWHCTRVDWHDGPCALKVYWWAFWLW